MILDSQRFLNSRIEGKFASVYLFLGDEDTLVQSCFQFLQSSYLKHYGTENQEFNIEKFQGDKEMIEKVIESCQTFPLLSQKKLVVLTHVEKLNDSFREQICAYLAAPAEFCILALLENSRPDKMTLQKALPQAVASKGVLVKCWKPFEEDRMEWIQKKCWNYGKKISIEAVRFLSEEGGESLAELASEIEKTVLLIGNKTWIQKEDLQQALSFGGNYTVWNLLEALEKKDLKNSLTILENCLEQGEQPVKLLHLIARSYRNKIDDFLLVQRDSAFAVPQAASVLLEQFKEADLTLKRGGGTESAVLEKVLIELCK